MKKITAIALLLALIATSTKPMIPTLIQSLKAKMHRQIRLLNEEIRLKKAPDWQAFDSTVNPLLQQLDKLGPLGKQSAANYRTQIENLKQTLVAATPQIILPPPLHLTPLALLEIDIQQLRHNLSEYFNNLLDGKIGTDQFTVKPFIEKVQKLEKDLPKMTTQERSQIGRKLNRTKEAIGRSQIVYVENILSWVKKRLDIAQKIEQKNKTKNDAIGLNNRIVDGAKFLDYAIKKGLRGNMNFTDYFVMAIEKKADQQDVIKFKTAVLELIKTMVYDWEAIMNVVKDDTKDKEMRKHLASNAGKSLAFAIKIVKDNFMKYLDDPKVKFKSKGKDHPFINSEDYTNLMKAEADIL